MITRFSALALLLLLATVGCGQKGPLVLPPVEPGEAQDEPAAVPDTQIPYEADE